MNHIANYPYDKSEEDKAHLNAFRISEVLAVCLMKHKEDVFERPDSITFFV